MFNGNDPRGDAPKVVTTELVAVGPNEIAVEKEHKVAHMPQKGAPCFDYMIDVETTGTNPEENGLLQIAAVRFNRLTKEIDTNVFDRCLRLPRGRYWDESTRDWWMDKGDVLTPIMQRAEDPAMVIKAFWDWVAAGPSICQRAFWGKPTTFDFNFIASYFRQYELAQLFHFREAVDLNSFLLGKGHENRREFWKTIPPVGDAHNALDDCFYQISAVFSA